MKRAIQFTIGAGLVCLMAFVVLTQTGFGQGGANPECPALRTDPFGFPIFPPYSEYPLTDNTQTSTGVISVLKENLPCCIDPDGNFVPADGVLERCIVPNVQFGSPPDITCPAVVSQGVFVAAVY